MLKQKPTNGTITQSSLLFSLCKIAYFLLPLPIALLSLSLMSLYMEYYDIGVSMTANNGFLVYFVAPALLISLYITATASLYLGRKIFNFRWLGIVLGSALMFMVGMGAFLINVQSNLDYPTEKPQTMTVFLNYYVSHVTR
ncbi:MAG: hypothetical protein HOP34_11440 [Methylococcaceae bacterium]|nr:hypothetical protein [Methylococcaceae bacterium]